MLWQFACFKINSRSADVPLLYGYSAKVAVTEMGITEPVVTLCVSRGPFLALHLTLCSEADAKLESFCANAWLVNSGWMSGPYEWGIAAL